MSDESILLSGDVRQDASNNRLTTLQGQFPLLEGDAVGSIEDGVRAFLHSRPRRPIPNTRNQARKRCHTRKHDLLFHQPCGGQVEQRDRPLRTDPGPSVQPPDKTKVFRLLVEISVAMSPCKTSPYAIIIARPADTTTRRD